MTATLDLSAELLEEPGDDEAVLREARYESFKVSRKHPAVKRIAWDFVVVGGEHDGRMVSHVTELDSDLLWLLRRTL